MQITALIHDCSLDGESGYAATCVEFPEANGQGETLDECFADLRAAMRDVLAFRREDAERSLAKGNLSTGDLQAIPRHSEIKKFTANRSAGS